MKKGSTKASPLAALSASLGIKGSIPPGSTRQLPVPSADEIREELQRLILKDLLGPADTEQEELAPRESRVRERYLLGALAPRGIAATAIDAATPLATSGSDSVEDGNAEGESSTTETMLPSSLGLSFMVLPGIDMLTVECAWGHYIRADSANAKTETGQARKVWKRTPRHGAVQLSLKKGDLGCYSPVSEQSDIVLRGKARQTPKGWLVTLFLVNQQEKPASREDEAWIFQPVVMVTGPGESSVFTKRTWLDLQSATLDALSRAEIQSLEMLYRHQQEFAAGHGVSVKAVLHDVDTSLAVRLETTFVPSYDVPRVDAPLSDENPDLAGIQLDMRALAEQGPHEVLEGLHVLHRAYEKWITRRRDDLTNGTDGLGAHTAAAKQALAACERAAQRIKEGIDVLSADPIAYEAFQFANRAMWQQRTRSILAKEVRKAAGKGTVALEAIDTAKNRSWRPFQLAFVLLNLPSLSNPLHPERSEGDGALCDLLWFPTGGGKTEAYLGLTAYTLALRRLQGSGSELDSEHGVAVLMRYTLRLLTLQQFQRASGLLCACESIRRGDPEKWGHTPMRIGLWVGRKTTPNTTDQAAEALIQIRNSQGTGVGTPAQLTSCPWCGCAINRTRHIKAFTGNSTIRRTIIYCGDELGECLFSEKHSPMEGLPVMVVDEEMYRNPPVVLVATVDKFAQMCWKGEVQTLFGRVSGWCERHGFRSPELDDTDSHPAAGDLPSARTVPHACLRPPDLIIQDELHLISGPLGSMVGLYEGAIDNLCTWTKSGQRVRPKVIASTATIRRAEQQVKQLFMRRVEVFPPAGLSLDDNFFSKRRKPGPQHPGRRYVGICAFGKRYPAAIIRLYVAILASAQMLYEKYDGAVDPWMTLVGYFNSIRELAGTRRLVEDDIRSRLQRADIRGLARRLLRSNPEELTSRRSGEEIPRILDRLDLPFSKAGEQHRKDEREKTGKPVAGPYDVVLATNMISVGVDVDRLGLMVVAGQPKTTAEYIQATSRVGRQKPGLVFCLYNWARPRDLSHFETFEHYHATFYQHVEALSVTPFAARALDRGLSGVMAAMIRLPKFLLNPNESAGDLRDDEPLLNACIDALSSRGAAITDKAAVKEDVRKMLAKRRDEWLTRGRRAKDHKLGYSNDGDVVGLLQQARGQDWQLFTCLNSLRDVEPTVNLLLADDRGLNPFDLKEPGPPETSAPAANPEELP